MSTVHLARIDPARNMCRFYRLDVQPDLFGGFAFVKEWGRIGARGRSRLFEMCTVVRMPLVEDYRLRKARTF